MSASMNSAFWTLAVAGSRRLCYRPPAARRTSTRATSENGVSSHVFPEFKIVVFSAQPYVRRFLAPKLESSFPKSTWVEYPLDRGTAPLAAGADAVCLFVNDAADAEVAIIQELYYYSLKVASSLSFFLSFSHTFLLPS